MSYIISEHGSGPKDSYLMPEEIERTKQEPVHRAESPRIEHTAIIGGTPVSVVELPRVLGTKGQKALEKMTELDPSLEPGEIERLATSALNWTPGLFAEYGASIAFFDSNHPTALKTALAAQISHEAAYNLGVIGERTAFSVSGHSFVPNGLPTEEHLDLAIGWASAAEIIEVKKRRFAAINRLAQ
ncbi:MAG: hypothetical protein V1659_03880 [Candidatus Woesearchaeota archaeon]